MIIQPKGNDVIIRISLINVGKKILKLSSINITHPNKIREDIFIKDIHNNT